MICTHRLHRVYKELFSYRVKAVPVLSALWCESKLYATGFDYKLCRRTVCVLSAIYVHSDRYHDAEYSIYSCILWIDWWVLNLSTHDIFVHCIWLYFARKCDWSHKVIAKHSMPKFHGDSAATGAELARPFDGTTRFCLGSVAGFNKNRRLPEGQNYIHPRFRNRDVQWKSGTCSDDRVAKN